MIELNASTLKKALSESLPKRLEKASKWDFGHILLVGGDKGFGGAVRMAGESALRTGAGMVSIITRAAHRGGILAGCPELMVHAVLSKRQEDWEGLLARANTLMVGPGLGRKAWGKAWWSALKETNLPMVVDADALNALSEAPFKRAAHLPAWILTPHVREAARLLKWTFDDVESNREKAVKELAALYGGVVILKGYHTLVHMDGGDIFYCALGNPGMATAGMGDILSGVLGGLLAQALPPMEAAKIGVTLHAQAGDLAAKAGIRGLCAMDLVPFIRKGINA